MCTVISRTDTGGMSVRVRDKHFVIPLNAIAEFVFARPNDLCRVEGRGLMLRLRREYIPCVGLYELLKIKADYTRPDRGILIIIEEGSRKMALLVDGIVGQVQTTGPKKNKDGVQWDKFAGATLSGNGKPASTLEVSCLFELAEQHKVI